VKSINSANAAVFAKDKEIIMKLNGILLSLDEYSRYRPPRFSSSTAQCGVIRVQFKNRFAAIKL
jgi:hypothetical protein